METTGAQTPTPTPPAGERFFAWIRSLGVQREKGWLGGVAAGVAVRVGIDPLIVRGILVVAALLGAPVLLVYAAAWLLLPDTEGDIHLERAMRGHFDSPIAAIGVTALLGLLPWAPGLWWGPFGGVEWPGLVSRLVWTLLLVGGAIWLVVWIAHRGGAPTGAADKGADAPTPPASSASPGEFAAWREQQAAWREQNAAYRREQAQERAASWRLHQGEQMARHREETARRQAEYRASAPHPLWSLLVIGLALVAGGLTMLVVGNGNIDPTSAVAGIAVAVGVLGLGVIVNGVRGKRGGGASGLASLLLMPLAIVLVLPFFSNVSFTGDRSIRPHDLEGSRPDTYFVATGDVTVDLTDFYRDGSDASDNDDVYVFVGTGDVQVLLPAGEEVAMRASIGRGDARVEEADGGVRALDRDDRNTDPDADRRIEIHVFVGTGDVTFIEEENR